MASSDLPPLLPYHTPEPRLRPLAIPVLGTLGLFFGLLRLMFAGTVLLFLLTNGDQKRFMAELYRDDRLSLVLAYARPVVFVALSLFLVVGSVGALRGRPRGRSALLRFGVAELIAQAGSIVARYAVERPTLARLSGRITELLGPRAQTDPAAGETAFWVEVGLGVGMALLCLYHFRRADVRRVFAATQSATGVTS
ncbi:MAG: hypothetical protein ACAI43_04310 [Phycisphaerae bacterium]|nr:hypothetical protein [Tepidisphaeraceae bacterium]